MEWLLYFVVYYLWYGIGNLLQNTFGCILAIPWLNQSSWFYMVYVDSLNKDEKLRRWKVYLGHTNVHWQFERN